MCKNTCYNCQYSRNAAFSTHKECNYPLLTEKERLILLTMSGNFEVYSQQLKQNFGFTPNQHGVINGWFNFPLDFDPVWMDGECNKHSNIVTKKDIEINNEKEKLISLEKEINKLKKENETEKNKEKQLLIDEASKEIELIIEKIKELGDKYKGKKELLNEYKDEIFVMFKDGIEKIEKIKEKYL